MVLRTRIRAASFFAGETASSKSKIMASYPSVPPLMSKLGLYHRLQLNVQLVLAGSISIYTSLDSIVPADARLTISICITLPWDCIITTQDYCIIQWQDLQALKFRFANLLALCVIEKRGENHGTGSASGRTKKKSGRIFCAAWVWKRMKIWKKRRWSLTGIPLLPPAPGRGIS